MNIIVRGEPLIGKRFNELTPVGIAGYRTYPSGKKVELWFCVCTCGRTKVVERSNLIGHNSTSCGKCTKTGRKNTAPGRNPRLTPTYQTWASMKTRCNNPNATGYKYWGGKGITYDPKWETYKGFAADMGERPDKYHVLHRIDSDGNYCKENCIWIHESLHTHAKSKKINA